ncbi:MAG: hypothetical protein GX162_06120 [Firmicutes bacterium]|jgi:ankyrin repeat protein|nr:hypothetical protein [Bacillota bacterium]
MKRTPLLISSLLLILTSCLATASVPSLLPFNPAWTAADVKSLIAAGVDVNARDESGSTPLIEAARWSNDPEVIQVLIDAGADIHARDELGFDVTALVAAAMSTVNPEVVRALVTAGADVNARDESGVTALMEAARWNGNPEVIKALIDAGADVNARDTSGMTALIAAAAWSDNPKALETLIKAGADVNAADESGMTAPIVAATWSDSPEVIQVLIDAGADLSAEWNGQTALPMAVRTLPNKKDSQVAERLIAAQLKALGVSITPSVRGLILELMQEQLKKEDFLMGLLAGDIAPDQSKDYGFTAEQVFEWMSDRPMQGADDLERFERVWLVPIVEAYSQGRPDDSATTAALRYLVLKALRGDEEALETYLATISERMLKESTWKEDDYRNVMMWDDLAQLATEYAEHPLYLKAISDFTNRMISREPEPDHYLDNMIGLTKVYSAALRALDVKPEDTESIGLPEWNPWDRLDKEDIDAAVRDKFREMLVSWLAMHRLRITAQGVVAEQRPCAEMIDAETTTVER